MTLLKFVDQSVPGPSTLLPQPELLSLAANDNPLSREQAQSPLDFILAFSYNEWYIHHNITLIGYVWFTPVIVCGDCCGSDHISLINCIIKAKLYISCLV